MTVGAASGGGGVGTLIYDTNNAEEMSVTWSGRAGRVRDGRAGDELRAALRRQQLLGADLLQHRREVVERRQPRRLPARHRHHARLGASSAPTTSAPRSAGRSCATGCGSSAATASSRPLRASRGSSATPTRSTRRTGTTCGTTASRCATCRAATCIRPGSPGRSRQKNRVTFSQENQYRCQGSTMTLGGEGCRTRGSDWVAMGSTTLSPEASDRYFEFPYWLTQATWTSTATQPAAARGRRQPARLPWRSRHRTRRTAAREPDPGRRAGGHRRASRQLRLPRHQHRRRQLPEHQELARFGVVRDRRSQHEGRLPGGLSARETGLDHRRPDQMIYRFNNGVPNQFTFRLPDFRTSQPHDDVRAVRAGHLDAWPAVAARRRCATTGPGAGAPAEGNGTTETSRFNAAPIQFERTASVDAYQRHLAARRRGLRRLRQRQDGGEVRLRPLPGAGHQRRAVHAEQPGKPHREQRVAQLAGRQRQLRRGLRHPQSGGAEHAGRRHLWRAHRQRAELRQGRQQPDTGEPRHPAGVGRRGDTTGSGASTFSRSWSRACRWTSATTGAGSGTSRSPTTRPAGHPITSRGRSWRPTTRGSPAAAATRSRSTRRRRRRRRAPRRTT